MHYAYIIDQRTPGKEAIIYSSIASQKPKIFRLAGMFFVSLSIISLLLLFLPIIIAEVNYRLFPPNLIANQSVQAKASSFGRLLWLEEKNLSAPLDWNFGLMIPKIGVNERVVANIDPNNKNEYDEILKTSLAHAKGTALPNAIGTTFIFGHSSNLLWEFTQKKAIFYHLKDLEKDDEIIVFFERQPSLYRVTDKVIVSATEVPDFVSQTSKKLLVLQTCWPPGTSWKRLFIVAELSDTKVN